MLLLQADRSAQGSYIRQLVQLLLGEWVHMLWAYALPNRRPGWGLRPGLNVELYVKSTTSHGFWLEVIQQKE